MGRAGTGYRFVCVDAGRSGAGVHGDVHGAGGDEFGGAGAADAVWHGRAKEEIFAPHGDGGDARSVLPDGASGGVGRRGDTSAGNTRRESLQNKRDESPGDERKRPWRVEFGFAKRSGWRRGGEIPGFLGDWVVFRFR